MRRNDYKSRGMTITELMISVGIVSMLILVAKDTFTAAKIRVERVNVWSQLRTAHSLMSAYVDVNGAFLSALGKSTGIGLSIYYAGGIINGVNICGTPVVYTNASAPLMDFGINEEACQRGKYLISVGVGVSGLGNMATSGTAGSGSVFGDLLGNPVFDSTACPTSPWMCYDQIDMDNDGSIFQVVSILDYMN